MTTLQDLLPLEGSKSALWKYFGFPSLEGQITSARKDRKSVTCYRDTFTIVILELINILTVILLLSPRPSLIPCIFALFFSFYCCHSFAFFPS